MEDEEKFSDLSLKDKILTVLTTIALVIFYSVLMIVFFVIIFPIGIIFSTVFMLFCNIYDAYEYIKDYIKKKAKGRKE